MWKRRSDLLSFQLSLPPRLPPSHILFHFPDALFLMSRLNTQAYHSRSCGFCGCLVNERNTTSYQAVSTQPGPATEHANISFDQESKSISIDSHTSTSWARSSNSFPGHYLFHIHCLRIFQNACPDSKVPLRYVIASASPICQVNPHHCHRLSELDAAALVTKFNPHNLEHRLHAPFLPAALFLPDASDEFSRLIRGVRGLPPELYKPVLSYCQTDLALAMTACVDPKLFMQLVRQDVVRSRVTMCIQAASLCPGPLQQDVFTEKVVELAEKMKATFVPTAGAEYLQDIGEESSNPDAIHFIIPKDQPLQLRLLVDEGGILNVAFGADAKGRPNWVRPDIRQHDIVLDTRKCKAIRIISDVSIAPGRKALVLINKAFQMPHYKLRPTGILDLFYHPCSATGLHYPRHQSITHL
jgi:hypothetical protein